MLCTLTFWTFIEAIEKNCSLIFTSYFGIAKLLLWTNRTKFKNYNSIHLHVPTKMTKIVSIVQFLLFINFDILPEWFCQMIGPMSAEYYNYNNYNNYNSKGHQKCCSVYKSFVMCYSLCQLLVIKWCYCNTSYCNSGYCLHKRFIHSFNAISYCTIQYLNFKSRNPIYDFTMSNTITSYC